MKEIIIEITPDGKLHLDAQGFKDGECALATKPLEDAAAGLKRIRKVKAEYSIPVKKATTVKTKR